MGETKGEYRVLVGRPEEKRTLRRLRRRQNKNINVRLQEMRWGPWTGLIRLSTGTGKGTL
jgi:hypothetical protein